MAVIDDVDRRRLIVELDRRQGCFLRVADVDGGLVVPILARCKFRFQVAPMTRPKRVPVIPGVLRMMFLGGTTHRQDKGAYDCPSDVEFAHLQSRKTNRMVMKPQATAACE